MDTYTTVSKKYLGMSLIALCLFACGLDPQDHDDTGQRVQAISDGGADMATPAPRLKPVFYANNGAAVSGPIAFWDTVLNLKCQPMQAADGATRCFPVDQPMGSPYPFFGDGSCSSKIAGIRRSSCASPGDYTNTFWRVDTGTAAASCVYGSKLVDKVLKLGVAISTPSSVYQKTSSTLACDETAKSPVSMCSNPAICDWYTLTEQPLSDFAEMTEIH